MLLMILLIVVAFVSAQELPAKKEGGDTTEAAVTTTKKPRLRCYECKHCDSPSLGFENSLWINDKRFKKVRCEKNITKCLAYSSTSEIEDMIRECGESCGGKDICVECDTNYCNKPLQCHYCVAGSKDEFPCQIPKVVKLCRITKLAQIEGKEGKIKEPRCKMEKKGDEWTKDCGHCDGHDQTNCRNCTEDLCNTFLLCYQCDNCNVPPSDEIALLPCTGGEATCSQFLTRTGNMFRTCGTCEQQKEKFAKKNKEIYDCTECTTPACNTKVHVVRCLDCHTNKVCIQHMSNRIGEECPNDKCIVAQFLERPRQLYRTCGNCVELKEMELKAKEKMKLAKRLTITDCLECSGELCNDGFFEPIDTYCPDALEEGGGNDLINKMKMMSTGRLEFVTHTGMNFEHGMKWVPKMEFITNKPYQGNFFDSNLGKKCVPRNVTSRAAKMLLKNNGLRTAVCAVFSAVVLLLY